MVCLIKKLRVRVLVENSTSIRNIDLLGKHGLGLFLEAEKENGEKIAILMDVGPSPDVITHNLDILKLNLDMVNLIFLSHGHYDHTGGLIEVLKRMNRKVPIIAHPKIFSPKYTAKFRYVGLPFTRSDVEKFGGMFLLAKNSVKIAEDIVTTGEIERVTEFEDVKGFITVEDGVFKDDFMPDDQALIFNMREKGLVVVSGCAHAGIVNTVKHAQKITGVNKIYGVLGGFHLEGASQKRIDLTIEELAKFKPKIVGPCHCTGFKAINQIANFFKENFVLVQTGDLIEI